MAKIKENLTQSLKTGIWVVAAVMIVNFILGFLKLQVATLFGVTPATGITPTIGMKIIATMQNLIAFDVMSIIYLYLSAVAILLVGSLALEYLPIPKGKNAWQRTAIVLGIGTAAFWLLLVGLKMPAMNVLLGLALYYVGVAITMALGKDLLADMKLDF